MPRKASKKSGAQAFEAALERLTGSGIAIGRIAYRTNYPPYPLDFQPISGGRGAFLRVTRWNGVAYIVMEQGVIMSKTFIKVELKFCECCGGLWLREQGLMEVYCPSCAVQMSHIAHGRKKPPVSEKVAVSMGGAVCA